MTRIAIRNGFIIALISFLWLLSSFFTGLHTPDSSGAIKGLLNIVILAFGIFLGIKETSRLLTNGHYGFWHLFKVGFLISAIVAVLTFFGRYIYFALINPQFGAELAGASDREYSSFWLAMISLMIMFGAGIIISIISSLAILKHR